MNHFRQLGTKLHSLSMINMVSAASVQPLEKEAAEAASTHAWCEEENKKNKAAKEKTDDKLEALQLRLDKANARKAELADNIAALTEEIAEIDASDSEALEIRTE